MPATLKEHDRVRITIETKDDDELMAEFAEWDATSAEDMKTIERKLEEIG